MPGSSKESKAAWYRRNADRLRAKQLAYRAANLEEERARDRARGPFKRRDPIKARAHRLVRESIKRGLLTREPCEVCGAPGSQGHHEDYDKPLEVRWLCARHHMALHRKVA